MKTRHKLDRPFGETGTTVGYVMILAGAIASFNSLWAIILIALGAFIAFTAKYTILDTEKKKVKSADHIFGIIPTGKWIDIKPDMKLGLNKSHKAYRVYSRSNRQLDIHERNIRIVLYNSEQKSLLDIKKFKDPEKAYIELEKLSEELKLSII